MKPWSACGLTKLNFVLSQLCHVGTCIGYSWRGGPQEVSPSSAVTNTIRAGRGLYLIQAGCCPGHIETGLLWCPHIADMSTSAQDSLLHNTAFPPKYQKLNITHSFRSIKQSYWLNANKATALRWCTWKQRIWCVQRWCIHNDEVLCEWSVLYNGMPVVFYCIVRPVNKYTNIHSINSPKKVRWKMYM